MDSRLVLDSETAAHIEPLAAGAVIPSGIMAPAIVHDDQVAPPCTCPAEWLSLSCPVHGEGR